MTIPDGGGDFDSLKAVFELDDSDKLWESYDVTSMVNTMKEMTVNFGFLLDFGYFDGSALGKDYHSSEAANIEDRPKLEITFEGTAVTERKTFASAAVQTAAAAGKIEILVDQPGRFTADLYNLQGRAAASAEGFGKTLFSVGDKSLAPGIYVLKISGGNLTYSKSVEVR